MIDQLAQNRTLLDNGHAVVLAAVYVPFVRACRRAEDECALIIFKYRSGATRQLHLKRTRMRAPISLAGRRIQNRYDFSRRRTPNRLGLLKTGTTPINCQPVFLLRLLFIMFFVPGDLVRFFEQGKSVSMFLPTTNTNFVSFLSRWISTAGVCFFLQAIAVFWIFLPLQIVLIREDLPVHERVSCRRLRPVSSPAPILFRCTLIIIAVDQHRGNIFRTCRVFFFFVTRCNELINWAGTPR